MTERLHVDWTRCGARGLCLELVPELLVPDDWGYPLSRTGGTAPVVPFRLAEHAERAVAECPRLALRLASDSESVRGRR
jgi:ferredoxin